MFREYRLENNIYLVIVLSLICLVGDYLISYTHKQFPRSIIDNATHGLIGGLSWLIVCINFNYRLNVATFLETICCAMIASLIDLDHFLTARSLHLKDAINLKVRPPLHCSTYPVIICGILLYVANLGHYEVLNNTSLITLTAFLSHHTRDATRRGFWLSPFGSTPAIPYYLYILIICIIPYSILFLYYKLNLPRRHQTVYEV